MARRSAKAALDDDPVERLGPKGRALWSALARQQGTPAGVLALEAARIVDRLEDLDRVIAGRGVLELLQVRLRNDWLDRDGVREVHVEIALGNTLGEARQQAGRLAHLVEMLAGSGKPEQGSPNGSGSGSGGESVHAQVLRLADGGQG